MKDKIKDKPKRRIVSSTSKWLLVFGSVLALLLVFSGMFLIVNRQDDEYSNPNDQYQIPPEIISTAEYLLENPASYDGVDLEITLSDMPSIGTWDMCFIIEGVTNFSGIASVDSRNRFYMDDFSGTPTPDPNSFASEEYIPPPSRICFFTEFSVGLHLIDLHLYETQKHYRWAIEIE